MARLIHHHVYPTLPVPRSIDTARAMVLIMQLAVIGGITVFLALTILNTILGTGAPEATYTPYE